MVVLGRKSHERNTVVTMQLIKIGALLKHQKV